MQGMPPGQIVTGSPGGSASTCEAENRIRALYGLINSQNRNNGRDVDAGPTLRTGERRQRKAHPQCTTIISQNIESR